jgi:uncharacterized protein HemY
MAWERRRNGRTYYYRKRRIGGRVVSTYCGRGARAVALAAQDADDQARAAEQRQQTQQERQAAQASEAPLTDLTTATAALTRAALIAGGYHQHKGSWRKQRDVSRELEEAGGISAGRP